MVADRTVLVDRGFVEFPTVPTSLSTQPHQFVYTIAAESPHSPAGCASVCKWNLSTAATKQHKRNGDNRKDATVPAGDTVVERYTFGLYEIPGEPCFVPKVRESGKNNDGTNNVPEDSGYLVVLVANGIEQTTDLVIFDVEGPGSLSNGPVSRARLPSYVPGAGLHGRFFPDE